MVEKSAVDRQTDKQSVILLADTNCQVSSYTAQTALQLCRKLNWNN